MAEQVAGWLVTLAGVYLGLGVVFAITFARRGAARIDPDAREGSWGFKVLIVPGATALWPLLLRRWLSGAGRPPAERNAHRLAARRRAGEAAR